MKIRFLFFITLFLVVACQTNYTLLINEGKLPSTQIYSNRYDCFSTEDIFLAHKTFLNIAKKQFGRHYTKKEYYGYSFYPVYQKDDCEGIYWYSVYLGVIGTQNQQLPVLFYKYHIHTWQDKNFEALLTQFLAECREISSQKKVEIHKIFEEKKLTYLLEVDFRK